ncbi:hypothetical protein SPRG_15107 [Saprolegnia parasitica CBS 223.65]|uniref:Uncharacterized protein n=1 Tax=Saprolegnia parasitica (strain CBS 223.65) TaxID=695850 RepID=A0A067BMT3_SAPPC|nr:hypothetical protein SPRG_15107 [Saprolegnia parasitica CBS 223.65]KDO19774.1 hypothetical protein SPRG_15107 [Saprolegnia parasitica CBS 223.65]|eukprot:XP_012209535.1 hypothetical protein SPRG_15107 [Saprolegnia parasitica CBS 223.65]
MDRLARYIETARSVYDLDKVSWHDAVLEGLYSRVLYWTLAGYALAAIPLLTWHLNKGRRQLVVRVACSVASTCVALALGVCIDDVREQIFFVLGLVVGAFCTVLHCEIAEMVREHLNTLTKSKND